MPITKGNDWNTAIGFTGEGARGEELTAGGHVCVIVGSRIGRDRNGNELLILLLDVLEGSEHDGIFKRRVLYNYIYPDCRKSPGKGIFQLHRH